MKYTTSFLVVLAVAGVSAEVGKANVSIDAGSFLAQAKAHSTASDLMVVEDGSFKVWSMDLGHNLAAPDYNEETHVGAMPISLECMFALMFISLIASVPFILAAMVGGGRLTRAHIIESVCLIMWLGTVLFLFTNVLKFNSGHWQGSRPLTTVESVYLLAQILTTVGYGDIVPAYPRGQVWVAINVLFALLLYGSIIMEVSQLLAKRLEKPPAESDEEDAEGLDSHRAVTPMKNWNNKPGTPDIIPLAKSALSFIILASIGVCFYHFVPGEDKTWLQAVYMSVITLSTVGFGWFSATTEAGKVFGAFWMLFGVATLAALIGSFIEWMTEIKRVERFNPAQDKLNFYRWVKNIAQFDPKLGDQGMDQYEFMKFGLLMKGVVTEEELQRIEDRFTSLQPNGDGKISVDMVYHSEGPPENLRLPSNSPRAVHDDK